jgi:hypothetical protein
MVPNEVLAANEMGIGDLSNSCHDRSISIPRTGDMKTTWLCIWIAFAAAEVGLTVWFHSARFLEIGALVPVMIAYNLRSARASARKTVPPPVEVTRPTPVIG